MDLKDKIITILESSSEPLSAKAIALRLRLDKQDVNKCLYSLLKDVVTKDTEWRWSLVSKEQSIETQILRVIEQANYPLKAREIGDILGLSRNIVNHYLYSLLKSKVRQDEQWRWTMIGAQVVTVYNHSPQPQTRISLAKTFVPSTASNVGHTLPKSVPSKPTIAEQVDPHQLILKNLENQPSQEKVEVLEKVFEQDRFSHLSEDEMSALSTMMESAKAEVKLAQENKRHQLQNRQQRIIAVFAIATAFILGILFMSAQTRVRQQINSPSTNKQLDGIIHSQPLGI